MSALDAHAVHAQERGAPRLTIVWRDESLVAIDKPSGLLTHRSPIDKRERDAAVQWLRDQLGQRVYPLHRLDRPTSGLLLFALDPDIARIVSEQFQQGRVDKRYLAVVRGHAPAAIEIDHPLRDETDHEGRRIADGVLRDARSSVSCLRQWTLPMPVDRYPEARYSLVELKPHTGRHRQLRRHMKHVSHPIIGDTRFGKGSHNRFFRDQFDCQRLLLASVSLRLQHPVSGEPLQIDAAPSADFAAVLAQLDAFTVGHSG